MDYDIRCSHTGNLGNMVVEKLVFCKMKKLAVRNILIMIAGTALCSIIHLYTHNLYLCTIQHACGFILLMTALILNYRLWKKTNKENLYLAVLFVVNVTIVTLFIWMYLLIIYIEFNI